MVLAAEPCIACAPLLNSMVIPELNTEMDVYRIGTMLEMVREVAMAIAVDGRRVKVCVQQALGQGIFTVISRLCIRLSLQPAKCHRPGRKSGLGDEWA